MCVFSLETMCVVVFDVSCLARLLCLPQHFVLLEKVSTMLKPPPSHPDRKYYDDADEDDDIQYPWQSKPGWQLECGWHNHPTYNDMPGWTWSRNHPTYDDKYALEVAVGREVTHRRRLLKMVWEEKTRWRIGQWRFFVLTQLQKDHVVAQHEVTIYNILREVTHTTCIPVETVHTSLEVDTTS